MTISKNTKTVLIISASVVCIILLFLFFNQISPEGQMKEVCTELGLENVEIHLESYDNFGGYTFKRTTIECDGFSQLEYDSCQSFFWKISDCNTEKQIFPEEKITVHSDGHTYTLKSKQINGSTTMVVYADGSPLLDKYSDKYKRTCSDCKGQGRFKCSKCEGKGKITSKAYDEIWHEWNYFSYTCTRCNGAGRQTCGQCSGTGYYYDIPE